MVATTQPPILSLVDFLALPETQPAQEYNAGIVSQKPMPKGKHSRLQSRLARAIDQVAEDNRIALALTELRCTFANRSIVPDIAVIRWEQLPRDANGEIADQFSCPPNWIIEILSPDQSATFLIEKIIFCLNAGTELGWLIDPSAKSVTLLQNGLPKVYGLAHNPQEPITVMAGLENWQITVAELFDWLKV